MAKLPEGFSLEVVEIEFGLNLSKEDTEIVERFGAVFESFLDRSIKDSICTYNYGWVCIKTETRRKANKAVKQIADWLDYFRVMSHYEVSLSDEEIKLLGSHIDDRTFYNIEFAYNIDVYLEPAFPDESHLRLWCRPDEYDEVIQQIQQLIKKARSLEFETLAEANCHI